jgi:hypothetical protein
VKVDQLAFLSAGLSVAAKVDPWGLKAGQMVPM